MIVISFAHTATSTVTDVTDIPTPRPTQGPKTEGSQSGNQPSLPLIAGGVALGVIILIIIVVLFVLVTLVFKRSQRIKDSPILAEKAIIHEKNRGEIQNDYGKVSGNSGAGGGSSSKDLKSPEAEEEKSAEKSPSPLPTVTTGRAPQEGDHQRQKNYGKKALKPSTHPAPRRSPNGTTSPTKKTKHTPANDRPPQGKPSTAGQSVKQENDQGMRCTRIGSISPTRAAPLPPVPPSNGRNLQGTSSKGPPTSTNKGPSSSSKGRGPPSRSKRETTAQGTSSKGPTTSTSKGPSSSSHNQTRPSNGNHRVSLESRSKASGHCPARTTASADVTEDVQLQNNKAYYNTRVPVKTEAVKPTSNTNIGNFSFYQ